MTWWLGASPEELRAARTCSGCGCPDADIDLGLCFVCFSAGAPEPYPEPPCEPDADGLVRDAAPDLLAALQRIVAEAEEHQDLPGLSVPAWRQATAAIAKATGGTA